MMALFNNIFHCSCFATFNLLQMHTRHVDLVIFVSFLCMSGKKQLCSCAVSIRLGWARRFPWANSRHSYWKGHVSTRYVCVCKVEFLGISTSDSAMIILKKKKLMTFITKLSLSTLYIYIYLYTKNTCIYICIYTHMHLLIGHILVLNYLTVSLLAWIFWYVLPLYITDNEGISL